MSDQFVGFVPKEPLVIPPVPEKIFDRLWLQRMIVEAPNSSKPVTVYVEFVPYNGAETLPTPITNFTIEDIFAEAAIDQEVALVMNNLFAVLEKRRKLIYGETEPTPVEPVEPVEP